ncbi:hypothetical protein [Sorangium sp. So ce1099]|uniref:hypothetical protein n=1 Tax=Sorangium sp. So ce1099 TaxID=3133331 RepID=UPI003F646AF3
MLGFARRGVKALEALAAGGPGAWRVVQELLVELIRAGETLGSADAHNKEQVLSVRK